MSWGEVKKVNSDLSVPLDERVQYVNGIVPRNLFGKVIYRSNGSGGEVLKITGKGCICTVKAVGDYYDGPLSASVNIYIDEDTDSARTIQVIASSSTSNMYPTASMSLDMDKLYTTIDVDSLTTITNSSHTINKPIEFKKSLRVTMSTDHNSSKGSSASIEYLLF